MIKVKSGGCVTLDGLMQKRRNSIANALELHLFCIKPSVFYDMLPESLLSQKVSFNGLILHGDTAVLH